MFRRVTLVITDVSEGTSASSGVTRIGELGTTLAVTSNLVFLRSMRRLLFTTKFPISPILVSLMMEALGSSETAVLRKAKRRNIPEDGILHSHHCENLKSYVALTGWAL
jgi:hypothetical protein